MSCGINQDATWIPSCCDCGVTRLAAAALIQPLVWELPHAVDSALKRRKKKKNTEHSYLTKLRLSDERKKKYQLTWGMLKTANY